MKAVLGLLTGGRGTRNRDGNSEQNLLPKPILEQLDFQQFEHAIGYAPARWRIFAEALLHRSFLPQLGPEWNSNERLEFLGDAVLNFIVAEELHTLHPHMEEGDLTKFRSRLVNRRILAERAKDLRLSDFILMSTSAAQSLGQGAESILADAFEAVIGALYVDGGMDVARKFVKKTLLGSKTMEGALRDDNYKSALLEHAQAEGSGIPRYVIVKEEGPDHDRRFTIEVYIGSRKCGVGVGRSKKEAEQAAAARALELLQEPSRS